MVRGRTLNINTACEIPRQDEHVSSILNAFLICIGYRDHTRAIDTMCSPATPPQDLSLKLTRTYNLGYWVWSACAVRLTQELTFAAKSVIYIASDAVLGPLLPN